MESICNKINMTQKLKYAQRRVENILGKGENAVYQHFLLFPNVFKSLLPKACLTLSQTSPGF